LLSGPTIALEGVTRLFGALRAVDGASIALAPGQIHAVIGENGAGKSTLMKLAAGVLAPSSGTVRIDGSPLAPATPAEAIRRGVGMVHQHFMLVGALSAIENLVLGSEPTSRGGVLDLRRAEAQARELMKRVNLTVPLDRETDALTVGERQRLEILRVLFRGARALLLDEPTAVLSPIEAEELYATLRRLADDGTTVAVVTHRLDEVIRFADRVTVMRRGRVVLSTIPRRPAANEAPGNAANEAPGAAADEEDLTRAIMGAEPPAAFSPPPLAEDAPVVLEVEGLTLDDPGGGRRLDGVVLSVKSGEIVGIAGIEGNGQRELVRALAGLEPRATGALRVAGRPLPWRDPAARRAVIAVVHEDRHRDGLMLEASVGDNLVLGELADPEPEAARILRRIQQFHMVPSDPSAPAGALSGGNQQKLVVARALDRITRLGAGGAAIIAQPTRGVDVGAAAAIHEAIGQAASAGLALVIISADLSELRKLSHRVLVIHRGRFVASLPPSASDDVIGRAMLGLEAA
jgi:simple sugar transport system ATP-binding protein